MAEDRNVFSITSESGNARGWTGFAQGAISGIATYDDDSPAIGAKVFVFDRVGGQLLGNGITDTNGEFSFSRIPTIPSGVLVVALDPDGGTSYNAIVYDKVVPV